MNCQTVPPAPHKQGKAITPSPHPHPPRTNLSEALRERVEEPPWVKMHRTSSSGLVPSRLAARCAAAGRVNWNLLWGPANTNTLLRKEMLNMIKPHVYRSSSDEMIIAKKILSCYFMHVLFACMQKLSPRHLPACVWNGLNARASLTDLKMSLIRTFCAVLSCMILFQPWSGQSARASLVGLKMMFTRIWPNSHSFPDFNRNPSCY